VVDAKISDYIIGILIFTLIIVGGISMLASFQAYDSDYMNSSKYDEYNNTMNVLSDVTGEVQELEDSVKDSNPDWGVLGALNALINSGWQTLKLTFESFSFMDNVFTGSAAIFGIPAWIATIIMSIITVVLVFVIYSAIFQREL